MGSTSERHRLRNRRKQSIKKKIQRDKAKLRLSVFKSERHIYAQIIDDLNGKTLMAESTVTPAFRETGKKTSNQDAAKWVGSSLGKKAVEHGIKEVYYDRNGFRYHGRVKVLADSVRETGIKF